MAETKRKSQATGKLEFGAEPGGVAAGTASGLDRLIHDRVRLGMLSALAVNDDLTFSELKKILDVTDGNLSVHARKLEEARYVSCTKGFENRFPKTTYRLTAAGRRALNRYLDHMESIIETTRGGRGRGSESLNNL